MGVCRCLVGALFFFFKQKTAYEMRISDWSSDVCSSDLDRSARVAVAIGCARRDGGAARPARRRGTLRAAQARDRRLADRRVGAPRRSEEHTSELQSLMRISYAVFCLKKKKTKNNAATLYKHHRQLLN